MILKMLDKAKKKAFRVNSSVSYRSNGMWSSHRFYAAKIKNKCIFAPDYLIKNHIFLNLYTIK
jgi:hypothetical protein